MPTIELDDLCTTATLEMQEAINNGEKIPFNEPTGLLSGLLSDDNTANTEIQTTYDRGNGMNSQVWLRYLQPDCQSDTTDECTNLCDEEGDSPAYQWQEVTADLCAQSRTMSFTEDEMRAFCETGSEFRMKQIANAFNSMRRNINAQLIPVFQAGVGGILNGGGGCCTPYNFLYRGSDGLLQVDPEGQIDMMQDLNDAGLPQMPIVVAGGNFKKYADLNSIACCNSTKGFDTSGLEDFMLFYDNQINGLVTGPSHDNPFFVWVPGFAQFISRPKNKGQFRKVNDLFVHDTIIDPLIGLEYDFNMKYDDCTGVYKWHFKLPFGLWQPPLTFFKDCDSRDGINWNWMFQAKIREAAE